MRLLDPRRLLGRNALLPAPSTSDPGAVGCGATLELAVDAGEGADDVDAFVARLRAEVAGLATAVGLPAEELVVRRHRSGASVAWPAPVDALRTAIDVLEWAAVVAGAVAEAPVPPLDAAVLVERLRAERSPALRALLAEAARRDVPALLYDDGLSLGHGHKSRMWPAGEVPAVDAVPWALLGRVPVALVTGTNGKTTTTRMLAAMLRATGVTVGTTSTDGVVIGGALVEHGDWSGPGGARVVLRDPRVTMAALETARGGLLRRGLAAEGVDAAVITNVSEDHLGDYGVHDLEAMADVKCVIGHGVRPAGRVVLNARDPRLVARAPSFRAPVAFFTLDENDPVVVAHVATGGVAATVRGEAITLLHGGRATAVLPVAEVPYAFGGAAAHNVENALAATLAADALGVPTTAIAAGLRGLVPGVDDAHGRSLVREHDGVRLLLDFAHNPAGVQAALAFVQRLRARDVHGGRLFVLTGAAGDRADDELRGVCAAIAATKPDRVVVRELDRYRRGKEPGTVPARLRAHLLDHGVVDVVLAADDVAALAGVLDIARPGDTIAMLIHIDGPGTAALLRARGWS